MITAPAAEARPAIDPSPADLDVSHWPPKRRDFLRMLGAGAGAIALGPLVGCGGGANASTNAGLSRAALLADANFWSSVEKMFILNPAKRFMNIGTAGSMPATALDLFATENTAKARDSLHGYGTMLKQREAIAPGFGVDADELALSGNTSSGMCHAILGIGWKAGDVVVTTNHEHSGGNVPRSSATASRWSAWRCRSATTRAPRPTSTCSSRRSWRCATPARGCAR